jgi:hypothetical protein
MSIGGWLRARRVMASTIALAVLIAAPVTVAILHNGFPLSDVVLQAKDVWVTNASKALVGRLNTQITELDGGVSAAASNFDVLQNGNNLFVSNSDQSSLARIDPSFATLQQKVDTPSASEVSYGGGRIAIVRPLDGALWILDATGPLQFDTKSPPLMKLGAGGVAAVGLDGTVAAASTSKHALYEIAAGTLTAVKKANLGGSTPSVTVVGSRAIALENGTLYFDDGSKVTPKPTVLKLQQPGADGTTVLVATGNSLLEVSADGKQTSLDAKITTPAVSAADVAAPVALGSCVHGAWSNAHRYLGVCDGMKPSVADVAVGKGDAKLKFRVNNDVIALNNITDGSVWIVQKNATIVDAQLDWNQATPPTQDNSQQTNATTSVPNFEQAVTDRSPVNHPPVARPDELGARPGKTTMLDVLANDTDPDGDVLTIASVSAIPESSGKLELIQGGRALQFVPAATLSGTVSFRYTVSDGRGGFAEANVDVAVHPMTAVDQAPVSRGTSAVTLEQGQTISYNVLGDWYDPDGDDLILEGASAPNAIVRYSPDGLITYTQLGSELGPSTVSIQVSDGQKSTNGQFIVDVKAPGSATPIGTPDFGSTFVNQPVQISPLANDLSPSGAALALGKVTALDSGVSFTTDADHETVSVTGQQPGTYYLQYVVAAGTETSKGLIRVDIAKAPTSPVGPTAVKDIAYVRPNQPVTLSVLDNDVSPSGAVLGIQSVTIPDTASRLSVQVLGAAKIKITAPSGMTAPVEFEYTISDGTRTSTTGVSVIPLPELAHHQAPIAVDDAAKARVSDIASVQVLANDYHPDGAQIHLDPNLVQANVGNGYAFVTGDQVRLQAPTTPGQYAVTYRIYDDFGESATAKVIFTVLPRDAKNNAAPIPQDVTARVFQGATLKVDVPLDGIDPDGDSVTLVGVGAGTLGQVADVTPTSFSYQAYGDKAGTDTFSYQVRDTFGTTATGHISIGVIPRPPTTLAPNAVQDQIAMRPGRVSSVPVMANDSDPNGYPIHLSPKLLEVQTGLTAKVDTVHDVVVVTASKKEGTYSVHYQIDNGHGGTADAFLIVKVANGAPLQPPVAFDQSVDATKVVGKHTVIVDVLHDAQNPGGLVTDLKVSAVGPNKSIATANSDGTITVTLGNTRQAVAYQLTNDIDKLSASAFIVVPPYSDSAPPTLKIPTPQNTAMNTAISWKLSDILNVPSGRPVQVADPSSAAAGRQAAGVPIVSGKDTIVYTPEKNFRGNTTVTFKVTDTDNTADPNATTISIPVIVGDPSFRDVPPTFANQTIEIQPGEAPKSFDLRSASSHPNPALIPQLTYQKFVAPAGPINASLSGSTVSMSTNVDTPIGTTSVISFTVNLGSSFSVPGQLTVKVVASTRPLPQTVDDAEPNGRSSTSYTISPLVNDFNPFADQGKPLKITDVAFQGPDLGATGLTHTDSTVSVTTGTAKSGTINLIYTVRDATNSAARQVQGRITVTVTSAPEPVTSFSVTNTGSQQVTVIFQPPVSSNGAPITGYTVRIAGSPGTNQRTDCVPGAACTFTGRTNGATQTVDVAATNNVGTTWSTTQAVVPFGTPSAPTNPVISTNSSTATATITPSWSGPVDAGGGAITYQWNFTQGSSASGSTTGTSGNSQNVGAGDYTFQVRACNPGGCSGYATSSSVHINNPPPPPPPMVVTISKGSQGTSSGCGGPYCYYIHIVASGFAANTGYTVLLETNHYGSGSSSYPGPMGQYGQVSITTDSSGSFNGEVSPYGFPGYEVQVIIGGVSSNIVTW